MTGKKLLFVVVALLVVSLALGGMAGCCPAGEEPAPTATPTATAPTAETPPPPAGGAPILEMGDTWTYKLSYPGTEKVDAQEVTLTATVDEADAEGYVVNCQFEASERESGTNIVRLEPPMRREYNLDLDLTRMETWIGTDIPGYDRLTLAKTLEIIRGEDKWPLTGGMQWSEQGKVVVVGVSTTDVAFTVKVEGIEEVTVDAGTFECYHVIWWVDGDRAAIERWLSTEVKGVVKEINRLYWRLPDDTQVPDTWELQSYSVAP